MFRNRGIFSLSAIAIAAVAALVLAACANPLDISTLNQIKDRIGPKVEILSPADGSSYAATVVVVGTVSDVSSDAGTKGSVKSLSYEIVPATLPGGGITVSADGSFTCQFPTTGFSGPMLIKIIAEDWNGNRTETTISLANMGAIPSFVATPGNHEVTLSWNPVPLAQSYTIYYEKSDIIPSEAYSLAVVNATSPCELPGLVNGDMHTFLLRAHSSAGRTTGPRSPKLSRCRRRI
ncbi:MAG: fibronectin type III domain-containing protein [Armatimonadetes bacterium]|nr:fibronectin type III domain-containing protein [Armatimonadota bacterium]